jgi:hypothetical protein
MDIKINVDCLFDSENTKIKIDDKLFKKMFFLFNALEDGWSIKKRNESYIFIKKHEGKKEIFDENYLSTFMKNNFDINKIGF